MHRRIVVKVGTSLALDPQFRTCLGRELRHHHEDGASVVLVSSGAVAMGKSILNPHVEASKKTHNKQAIAAIGQVSLFATWQVAINPVPIGQVLIGLGNTEDRLAYLASRDALTDLWALGAIPVVNENDVVASARDRYGDNDRLAARIAVMMDASMLVLLTDIDGFYTKPPSEQGARHLPYIATIDPHHHGMAGESGSRHATGGMKTKLDAAEIATRAGCQVVLGCGTATDNPIEHARRTGTIFEAQPWQGVSKANRARRRWIGATLNTKGVLSIDDGAANALYDGKNMLLAGVWQVEGQFDAGAIIELYAKGGEPLGKGIVELSADELREACRDARQSQQRSPHGVTVMHQRNTFLY
ncbi:MAG: glutamate 5-kinase [Alphaproteobacteria bacterium]|nr:glutamate 5-kinase [Alphaproteobacteria bacterium]